VAVKTRKVLTTATICGAAVFALASIPVQAQFLGHNFHGDYGLQSATQPPPGFWLAAFYLRYDGDSLRDRNGDEIKLDPEARGEIDTNSYVLGLWWVSKAKILGANYSLAVFPALTDNVLSAPLLGLEQKTATGSTDLYIQPINLGWHTPRADYTAGLGVYAPTGRFEPEASDNLGLGMWSFELFGGATAYFDKKKSWHFATTAFYETHTDKKDTDIRVGDILTLEGGLGKSFKEGAINTGVAYYAQWKVTDDDLGLDFEPPGGRRLGRHRVYGLGPELTLPIATKKKLIGFVNLRYFWEFGARTTLEGNTFTFTMNFPIPSISLG
jgi:hypothetical protein